MFDLIPWTRRGLDEFPAAFRREFDDLLRRFVGDEWLAAGFSQQFSPAVDFSETDQEFILKAEIPGVDPKDLDISLTGETLTITGEKKEEKQEKGKAMQRVERSFGSFTRSFTLPCQVQEDKIKATFADGLLTVKLPKAETAKKKAIRINAT